LSGRSRAINYTTTWLQDSRYWLLINAIPYYLSGVNLDMIWNKGFMWLQDTLLLTRKDVLKPDLKNIGLQLCTCTYIEIMTGLGISLYLLFMHNYTLSILSAIIFAPLIVFHYVISRIPSGRWEETCGIGNCNSNLSRLHFTRASS
jgi:hypothetical protein